MAENSQLLVHYQEFITAFKEEEGEKFKNACSDEERIRALYHSVTKHVQLQLLFAKKSRLDAEKAKTLGNNFFAKKDYDNALQSYNEGIKVCPQDTEIDKELLSILVANRSAVMYEKKQYRQCLNDIVYVTNTGTYPNEFNYKLYLRKAKCHDFLNETHLAVTAYEKAQKCINDTNDAKLRNSLKSSEIVNGLNGARNKLNKDEKAGANHISKTLLSELPITDCILINEDEELGRFACANSHFKPGVTILEEEAYCSVLAPNCSLKNCGNCLRTVDQPVVCPNCPNIVFCNFDCQKIALSSYHKYECRILRTILDSGASLNCIMALRLITQTDLSTFNSVKGKLTERKFGMQMYSDHKDYDYIYNLCRHEHMRTNASYLHYAFMSVYLLRLLKSTTYFQADVKDEVLTENEAFIGGLILRHFQILQFNAHEISELELSSIDMLLNDENYKSVTIGAGLYPTVALFNHSCDPSIVRYHEGTKIIVRTIKPIEKGSIIYENYGSLYTSSRKSERQAWLQERYWFECRCDPCLENWPMFKEMDNNVFKIRCNRNKCRGSFYVSKDLELPFMTCPSCKNMTNILPMLKSLSALEEILPEAEMVFKERNFKKSAESYIKALNIFYECTVPPFPDIMNVQQRLRTCLIHEGNKSLQYMQQLKK